MTLAYRTPLRERTRGRWPSILAAFGIAPTYLTRKNGPCPLCPGGRDRWRFLDTDGNGTWICSQCGSGGGADLLMRFTGLPFKQIAEKIESIIGSIGIDAARIERDDRRTRAGLKALWRDATAVQPGDPTDRYLRSRGIMLEAYPPALRTGIGVRYFHDDARSSYPAMLAIVTGTDGKPTTIHRTYLTDDGRKAPVEKPRKLYSSPGKGSAIRLAAPTSTLGIAEGIETALSASILFKVPVWSAICANGLVNFEPPATVNHLLVLADNDLHHVSQAAAHALAARLFARIRIDVRIPEKPGTDWNDVLAERGTAG
jgi:putative DNA primase/helicase